MAIICLHPNSAIVFLILPVEALRHDQGSESRQKAVNLKTIRGKELGQLVAFSTDVLE